MLNCVFFPGSFNPFTKGHADIVTRLLALSEKVVIGIGCNIDKEASQLQAEENAKAIENFLTHADLKDRVSVKVYTGLTAHTAIGLKADCIARGVRSASDFDYEYALAAANKEAFGIDTIIIPANPALACVSSTLVRDIIKHGDYITAQKFLP